mgnify:CR=1 FL=1
MSITYYGIIKRSASQDRNGIRRAVDVHQFVTDAAMFPNGATPYDIGRNSYCPRIGQPYSGDPFSWCIDVNIELSAPKHGWTVTASYSSEREISENPLDEPAKITWGSENFQEVAVADINGKLVLNSAGDPFDPPLMKDFSRRTATVTKNVSSVPSWFFQYEDAVNSSAFSIGGLTVATGKALCKKTSVSVAKVRNGIVYYEVTTELHFSKKGWKARGLDAGFRYKYFSTADSEYRRADIVTTNEQGVEEKPTAPVPLDGNGQIIKDPTPSNCVFLEFDICEALDFSQLPLY